MSGVNHPPDDPSDNGPFDDSPDTLLDSTPLPFGRKWDAHSWKKLIDGGDATVLLLCAESLALRFNSVSQPETVRRKVQIDLTRIDLIFLALEKYYNLDNDDEQLFLGYRKINKLLDDLIENGTIYELLQLGKYLQKNRRILPNVLRGKKIEEIFDKLLSIKCIEEIAEEVILRESGIWEEEDTE